AYAPERRQFGRAMSARQAGRPTLVEARTKLEACRGMLYRAAWLAQQDRPCSVETSMAKLFVADTAVEIAIACQRVMGAYGLAEGHDMERHVRDLLGMPILGGSASMQHNSIANRLGLRDERQDSRSLQGREAAAQRGEAERSVGPREGGKASEDHRAGR